MPLPLPGARPIPAPPTNNTATAYPYYIRNQQPWRIEALRARRVRALWSYGELAYYALMWHLEDFEHGLVQRCPRCYSGASYGPSDIETRVAGVYQQAIENKCPVCFGTTFEGGYKALIIRPTIFSDTDEGEKLTKQGLVNPTDLSIESTTDFRVRTNDYVFRSNGDRFQLRIPTRTTARTGFGTPHQTDAAVGYNLARANQEDRSSVAYLIPPDEDTATSVLSQGRYTPPLLSQFEDIRAELIPSWND